MAVAYPVVNKNERVRLYSIPLCGKKTSEARAIVVFIDMRLARPAGPARPAADVKLSRGD